MNINEAVYTSRVSFKYPEMIYGTCWRLIFGHFCACASHWKSHLFFHFMLIVIQRAHLRAYANIPYQPLCLGPYRMNRLRTYSQTFSTAIWVIVFRDTDAAGSSLQPAGDPLTLPGCLPDLRILSPHTQRAAAVSCLIPSAHSLWTKTLCIHLKYTLKA